MRYGMDYIGRLKEELDRAYAVAAAARKEGFDPTPEVEVKIAPDVAARVESIVGPPGIALRIREKEKSGMNREDIAFELAGEIASGKIIEGSRVKLIDQAIRTAMGILTEGVLVAPTEGISDVKIKKNGDGTEYLAIYYAGPIRSAGGTAMALSAMIGDVARKLAGVGDYRASDTQVERFVEEVNMYESRASHLQYKPPDDDLRYLVRHCPVGVDGSPTEEIEVSAYRDVPGVDTNRIRGGVPLVLCEGIAQKAAKLLKHSRRYNAGWDWLEKIVKVSRAKNASASGTGVDETYLEGLVAGRPVFAYPSRKGGFRLRYGRSGTNGLMAKSIHPATMTLLDDFLAVGTHMKIERPGKGCVVAPHSGIEPPVVRLKDGEVRRVRTVEEARSLQEQVEQVLSLGDMLSTYGDFLKSNQPLLPSGFCVEWWEQEVEARGTTPIRPTNARQAFEFSRQYGVPLHPDYTYPWHDVSVVDVQLLQQALRSNEVEIRQEGMEIRQLKLPNGPAKKVLEDLLVEHRLVADHIVLDGDTAYTLLASLGVLSVSVSAPEPVLAASVVPDAPDALACVNTLAGIPIFAKAPTYIGARMGRPEKAKERRMDGTPNVLFPSGSQKNRSLTRLYRLNKTQEGRQVQMELARFRCQSCRAIGFYAKCMQCQGTAVLERICAVCKQAVRGEIHCDKPTITYEMRTMDLNQLFGQLRERLGFNNEEIKGVKGLSNVERMPERLEKGYLRAKHDVYVFRDGTSRFDATNVPITHFRPCEIGTSVARLRELGYTRDYLGHDLADEGQLVPLYHQDIVLADNGADYFLKVAAFLDDLLMNFYGLHPFYKFQKKEELVGHLVLSLSPHTSAAVLGRVIGFTRANVGYSHPYTMTARRRNADGDEDSCMLLMDALLNFSRHYLNERRGGTMDAPLVLTPGIDPREVDDEVHCLELVSRYPLEFYRAAQAYKMPNEVKLRLVKHTLGTPAQFDPFPITHPEALLHDANLHTKYVQLGSVPEKLEAQFALQDRLRAVDQRDAAQRLMESHFIPDLYGNLRSYSRQSFRCGECNESYRRPPLAGKCVRCGGNLLLTINKGGIEKYLQISKQIIERYQLPEYTRQLIWLVEREIRSIFQDDKEKQTGLADFV